MEKTVLPDVRRKSVGLGQNVISLSDKPHPHDPDLIGTLVSGSTGFHCDELYFL